MPHIHRAKWTHGPLTPDREHPHVRAVTVSGAGAGTSSAEHAHHHFERSKHGRKFSAARQVVSVSQRNTMLLPHRVSDMSPLYAACRAGHHECARLIIDVAKEAVHKERAKDGSTPLHVACEVGSDACACATPLPHTATNTATRTATRTGLLLSHETCTPPPMYTACGTRLENVSHRLVASVHARARTRRRQPTDREESRRTPQRHVSLCRSGG
jgi:hypothetical protein